MPWLTKGTARWAQSTLGDDVPQQVALPDTVASRAALLASRYGAAGFWSTLAVQFDPKGGFAAPAWLQALHYANRKSVRGAAPVRGAEFIRHVFEAMGRADHAVARAQGWPIYDWSETDQKSPDNDTPAWTALMDVLRTTRAPGVTVAALLAFDAAQPMAGVP